MSVNTIILIVIAVCALLVVGSVIFVGIAAKKKWPLTGIFAKVDSVLAVVDNGIEDVTPFIPSKYGKIAELVIAYAKIAVEAIEQLYKVGSVAKDQRKAEAEKFVTEMLNDAGIKEISPATQRLMDFAIEAAVLALK